MKYPIAPPMIPTIILSIKFIDDTLVNIYIAYVAPYDTYTSPTLISRLIIPPMNDTSSPATIVSVNEILLMYPTAIHVRNMNGSTLFH